MLVTIKMQTLLASVRATRNSAERAVAAVCAELERTGYVFGYCCASLEELVDYADSCGWTLSVTYKPQ